MFDCTSFILNQHQTIQLAFFTSLSLLGFNIKSEDLMKFHSIRFIDILTIGKSTNKFGSIGLLETEIFNAE